ncbi:Tip elongation aberrant protein [Paramyrothecium foliicola]|nr:Tip elongation aberrant protein [Paramyrothecium foliicola]
MSFLFKSKKGQDRQLASRDGTSGSQGSIQSASSRVAKEEKAQLQHRATPTGSMHSIDNEGSMGSPDHGPGPALGHGRRGGSVDQTTQPSSDLPLRNGPPVSNPNASLFPWSQRRLTYTSSHPSPFPRYGAAVNSVSSKEGDIYMMGGLINSSTVKGDLWMIEAGGNMACYPLATTAEGPGPRVGHSSLLVGNAFIVYGGDTKIDENDVLDETLYLLNTSTRQWSRALPAGPRPSGRYGHSLNILGSKIFIFGGQVEGYFMNDLSAFDLNQLQMPNNRWEILLHGETSPKTPAARTNHSMITYDDKMFLFGGTNGFQWFNDVWCYEAAVNKWSQLDCRGYIPCPREGHASALVGDVMYVFGGRTEEGSDLGDLAAFKISTRRWYTFQNMGPSPSPRSGHSMTTVGKSIVVLGGEPSSAATAINDLGILYVLDTTKIQYPAEGPQQQPSSQNGTRGAQARRPSTAEPPSVGRNLSSRDGSTGPPDGRRLAGTPTNMNSSPNGHKSPTPNGTESPAPLNGPAGVIATGKGPKPGMTSTPPLGSTGSPPHDSASAKSSIEAAAVSRVRGASADRAGRSASPMISTAQPPATRETIDETESPIINGRRTPTQTATRAGPRQEPVTPEAMRNKPMRPARAEVPVEQPNEAASKAAVNRPVSPPPPKQATNPLARRSSGRNSQTVALLKELDSSRNRNAWYASELELARKAGYVPNAALSPALDAKAAETFDDEDRPLIEALLAMRTELANVQSAVDKQAVIAARQVAEAEKQRDAAIQEAVYAKAKLAAQLGSTSQLDVGPDHPARSDEISKKLASALHLQKELNSQLDSAKTELDAERKARQLADDTASAAQKRMAELENYKQTTSTEVERLKAELHYIQREAREHSITSSEAVAAMELLRVEKDEIASRLEEALTSSKDHGETFTSLRGAMLASDEAKAHVESRLENERTEREKLETKFNMLKAEHEARTAELVAVTQRLRDAEEIAEKHANEARTHRQAVLSGLDKISARDVSNLGKADTERINVLQNQVASANAMVKKYQQEADSTAEKLRSAEERIAGLEQYQEQSSREGVTIRRQLQSALRETQGLQAANTDLKNQLAAQQLETNAMTVQHTALKGILSERGISPTAPNRSRGLASPEQSRLKELEAQLSNANAAHEETKQAFAQQAQESEAAYREKLSQLESDYQSAVHYVKGTEKMLKQLKDQLSRYKTDNGRLKAEIEDLEDQLRSNKETSTATAGWEKERDGLHTKVGALEQELRESSVKLERSLEALRAELGESKRERDEAVSSSEEASKKLASSRKELEELQSENALLEQRANDAEQKVSLLLDQVEHSVDNYRRRSRQVSEAGVGTNGNTISHTRNESSDAESAYGANSMDARNSAALDNLASELETLRSHWEATNKNYRLSTNFDFESAGPVKKDEDDSPAGLGLSESLADWRKRLDAEESQQSDAEKNKQG